MDIKTEPDDDYLSTNSPQNSEDSENYQNNENSISYEGQWTDVKVETILKEEGIAHGKHDQIIQFLPSTVMAYFDLPSTSLHWDQPQAKALMNERNIQTEISEQKTVAVINMENFVFYERNFVCSVCYNVFPSRYLLQQHVISHAKRQCVGEERAEHGIDYAKEPDYFCRSYIHDNWNQEHAIDIEHDPLGDHDETINDQQETHQKLRISNDHSSVTSEPTPTNSSQNQSVLKNFIKRNHTKIDNLLQGVVAVIKLEKVVSYERNFVCNVCFQIFPLSHLLDCHLTMHENQNFYNEISEMLEGDVKLEPLSPGTLDDIDGHENDVQSEGHLIDIKDEALEFPERLIGHQSYPYSNKMDSELNLKKRSRKKGIRSGIPKTQNWLECDQCTFKGSNPSRLKRHKVTHSGEKPFECDQCMFRTGHEYSLKYHKLSHDEPSLQCDLCSYKTNYPASIKRHMTTHTGKNKTFKCDQCSYKTDHPGSLKRHMITHNGEKTFECDQCSYKTAHDNALKRHKKKHTGEKPFECDQCMFKTFYARSLKFHLMNHRGEKPLHCDQCSYKTAKRYRLKTHKLSHTGEKPFECDQCSFKTTHSGNLNMHKKIHTGEKPFQCDQCSYKSVKSSQLKMHKKGHTGEKTSECDQCSYKTDHPGNLKVHKMTHNGTKPLECEQCSYKTNYSGKLKVHKKTHIRKKK